MQTAVLLSGGLDSAVLLAEEAARGEVQPVYVSVGLAWEQAERQMIDQLLTRRALGSNLRSLAVLSVDMTDVYQAAHWAIQGKPPAYDTPDEDVYLTGRNLVLLTKAGVVAAQHDAHRIALGPLAGNPFPDARPQFFTAMSEALSLGLDRSIAITTPFLRWEKKDVIKQGVELGVPLELTLSCMNPAPGPQHCGLCSKCRERRDAFADARVADPTTYVNRSPR
jgi:7-cyano-7-deazaguanine synthase